MSSSITTIESRATKDCDTQRDRTCQLANRQEDLTAYARIGYSLVHTHGIDTTDCAIFVDTLTRANES
jgi:hypothetical protein